MPNNKNAMPKGWYSRSYLPHCDAPGLIQAITFRLADALPKAVLERIKREARDDKDKQQRIEAHLDAGHGSCLLREPHLASIVECALLHFDGKRYRLLAWCIMPNHVHVLIETLAQAPSRAGGTPALQEDFPHTERRHLAGLCDRSLSLSAIIHSWKSFSAKEINKSLARQGTVWQREYFDRYIRDDHHLAAAIAYILDNPVKAGLVARAEDWPFRNARLL